MTVEHSIKTTKMIDFKKLDKFNTKIGLIVAVIVAVSYLYDKFYPSISNIKSDPVICLEHQIKVLTAQIESESELDKRFNTPTIQMFHGNKDKYNTPKSSMVHIEGERGDIFMAHYDRRKSKWVYTDIDGNIKVIPE